MMGAAALGAGCFVTGTDTEVGKTRISAALVHWAAAQGWRSAGYKPVAAGITLVDGNRANDDVRMLQAASSVPLGLDEAGPLQLDVACAPHIAASLQGIEIDIEALVRGAGALRGRADLLVVEGVGGFCVPLGPAADSADLARALGLPVVLVVGLRLGCLNHALLTAEAVRARGLALAGWIGNRIDPGMAYADENVATLRHELHRRHQAPCLGVVPWLPHDDGPARVAAHFDASALADLLGICASRRAGAQR